MPEYPFERDPRVDVIWNGSDFNTYQQKLPDLYLKPEVNPVVHEHVEIVRKILTHSFFVYEFIDVAFTYLIIGLEKALKIRYHDLTGKDCEKKSLNFLIEWAEKNNLFEADDTVMLKAYRNVRNSKVHAPINTLGGYGYLRKMMEPIGFINDLYEDVMLRKTRKAVAKEIQKQISNHYKYGGLLTINGKTFLVDDICMVFFNNKLNEPVHSMFTTFIMNAESIKKQHKILTGSFKIMTFKIDSNTGIITGIASPGYEKIRFSPVISEKDKTIIQDYRTILMTGEGEGMIMKWEALQNMDDLYFSLLHEFYKIGTLPKSV